MDLKKKIKNHENPELPTCVGTNYTEVPTCDTISSAQWTVLQKSFSDNFLGIIPSGLSLLHVSGKTIRCSILLMCFRLIPTSKYVAPLDR